MNCSLCAALHFYVHLPVNKVREKTESAWLNLLLFPVDLTFREICPGIEHKNECEGIGEVDERS